VELRCKTCGETFESPVLEEEFPYWVWMAEEDLEDLVENRYECEDCDADSL